MIFLAIDKLLVYNYREFHGGIFKMKRIGKYLSIFVILAFIFVLASCSGYNFYKDFKNAGAEIDSDHSFIALTADEVDTFRKDKKEFVIIVGSSTNSTCVSAISKIQDEFTNIKYTGKAYFLSVKDALTSTSEGSRVSKILNSDIDAGSDGVIVIAYDKNGNIKFNTKKADDIDTKKFKPNGTIAYRAIADYIAEYYPVEE